MNTRSDSNDMQNQPNPIYTTEQINRQIVAIKTLRRDIDVHIQNIKALGGSAERTLAYRKLQEGVMWLGMDLKRINEENPSVDPTPPKTLEQCAIEAYTRYGSVTDFKNFQGNPMPTWDNLTDKIREAWKAAITIPLRDNPYPNSKDPSNTKIDKTADGLKL